MFIYCSWNLLFRDKNRYINITTKRFLFQYILNEIAVQTDFHHFMTINDFGTKRVKWKNNKTEKQTKFSCQTRKSLVTAVWCVTSRPPRPLNVSIVVKPFIYFNAMHRSKFKQQHQICGPQLFNKVVLSVTFLTYINN